MRHIFYLRYLLSAGLFSLLLTGCPDTEPPAATPTATEAPEPVFPEIVVSPNPVEFGDVLIYGDEYATKIITIRNNGDGLLYLGDLEIVFDGDQDPSTTNFQADFPEEDILASQEEVSFALIFDPSTAGYLNGVLRIESNDEANRELDVDLLGNGSRGTDNDGDDVTIEEGDCNDDDDTIHPGADEICNLTDNDCDEIVDEGFDVDEDGYTICDDPADCNDGDATVNPGADEICDGQDNDCDEIADEGFDADNDGSVDCIDDDGDGYSEDGSLGGGEDCDDTNPNTYPGAPEICDGQDNDCDGVIDNDPDDDGIGGSDCLDDDGDGQSEEEGDCNDENPVIYDDAPEQCDFLDNDCDGAVDEGTDLDEDNDSYTACDGDCNNNDASVYPGATEVCDLKDNDCDTQTDEGFDADVDGYAHCAGDCEDDNPTVNPGVPEVCDGIDNNCNDAVDEGFDDDGIGGADCFDNDGDGQTEDEGDCNDDDGTVYDGAPETCDGVDDDCDNGVDEGALNTFYGDGDKDNYGTDTITFEGCEAPAGYAANDGDCNDADAAIYPGAPEQCNGKDDDCDNQVDEGSDSDGDGYFVCGGESDCDDGNADINPGATEVCDGVDNNCNNQIDEGFDDDGSGGSDCVDNDGDGQTEDEGDCDDTDDGAYTGGNEACDSTDNDCDGTVDEGVKTTYYDDDDGDTYGDPAATTAACSAPANTVQNGDDCDDQIAAVNPAATEICNNRDDNCNGQTDEGFDADGDGYATCENDCDDNDPELNPGNTEICNGEDDDCDVTADEGFDIDGDGIADCNASDDDGDGYSEDQYDCDDTDPNIYPITVDATFVGTADGSIDKPYRKIQVGLNNCETCPYVWVRPSTYFENVVWPNYDAWLLSIEGPVTTVINGSTGDGPALAFDQAGLSGSRVDGFTIRNGLGRDSSGVRNGGGVYITVSSPTLANNIIRNNTVDGSGAGIYVTNGGHPTLRNNTIRDNTISTSELNRWGGGLFLNGTYAVVEDNLFEGNQAPFGGGMAADDVGGVGLVLKDNRFIDNRAEDVSGSGSAGLGGGLWADDSTISLEDNTFEGNSADSQGGGAYHDGGSSGTYITGNTFTDNEAGDGSLTEGVDYVGGALVVRSGDPEVYDNSFTGNGADENAGALYLRSSESEVYENTFTNNTALDGGAVVGSAFDGDFYDNTLSQNVATDDGGALLCYLCEGLFRDNDFTGNSAADDGGGIYSLDGLESYRNNQFIGNEAPTGGAAYFFRGEVLFAENLVDSNIAQSDSGSGRGAGIMLSSSEAEIIANTFVDNEARGSRGSGAGIRVENYSSGEAGNPQITNNFIQGNESYRGAGVSFEEGTDGVVVNNTIVQNSTGTGDFSEGGGIYVGRNATPNIRNNIVSHTALGEGIHLYSGDDPVTQWPEVEYNLFFNNQGEHVNGGDFTPGAGNIMDSDPQFTNLSAQPGGGNYLTVQGTSPTINAGDPGGAYQDQDGSRNDMGAYGGPDAP